MKLGALLGPITAPDNPGWLSEQAARLEGEGFESLWTVQTAGRGFMFPDPFLALASAAASTAAIELGTAIVQAPLYHPADLAHRVFSLHQICGNRLILGLGAGSTREDFQAFGRDYDRRFDQFRSTLTALRDIFQQGENGVLTPWPCVARGPRLFLGAWQKGMRRAAREFDGWIASAAYRTPDEVVAAHAEYRANGGARAVVSSIQVGARADLGELKALLGRFAEAGFDDAVVFLLPGAPPPEAIRKLVG